MSDARFSRRRLLAGVVGVAVVTAAPRVDALGEAVHVLKDPGCGCCTAWVDILRAEGFAVSVEEVAVELLARFKAENGIPAALTSCHSAQVAGYMVEGHVPPADIRRLLDQRPGAVGLAVPGMPSGAPGMGPESAREAYDVLLVGRDGSARVFARYGAA